MLYCCKLSIYIYCYGKRKVKNLADIVDDKMCRWQYMFLGYGHDYSKYTERGLQNDFFTIEHGTEKKLIHLP